mmetsp:Transcript_91317/g.212402  ORF Transcript_91317/g.212402 Transcript_91317/m.212402 type:complete len:593 (+) Transcript_91317:50-1828(+)
MAVAPTDATDDSAAAGESAADKKDAVAASEPKAAEDQTPKAKDIFMLARQQNFPVALKLLEAYPHHWLATDEDGHSLLHWGSLVGSRDFCRATLAHGVPVDSVAENKQTPLMWAVLRGHIAVARVLLDSKANLQTRDSLGATALMIAIQHKNYASMLLLMNRGKHAALLGDVDKNGCTPVHWAAYKGDLTALKLLDYFGADMVSLDNSKMLPLHRAVCASQGQVIEFLLEKRSDPTQRNADGKTVLDIAGEQQDNQMQSLLKKLLKKGDPSSTGSKDDFDLEAGDEAKPRKRDSFMKMMMKAGQDKTAQKAFPVFWMVCVSLAVFEYLMDLRRTSYQVAPTASMLFEVGVPLSLALFFYVALADPGKLPTRAKGNSGVEELMRALDSDLPEDSLPDVSRLCTTTWVLKDLRTKYCSQTGACVEEFDHWCVWLNCSIGKKNHRQFIGLAIVEWATQMVHIYLLWCMTCALVPYQTFGSWLLSVITGYPLLAFMGVIQILTMPFVLMLIIYQSRLVSMNLTTNEMMNMSRYEHFKVTVPGSLHKIFRNPFNKGGAFSNCLDFWWYRKRSVASTPPELPGCRNAACASGHCRRHG